MPRACLAIASLLLPAAAAASGVVPVPVKLEAVVQRSSAIVLGRTLGTRDVRVRIPIAETRLTPRGRTHLEFTVRQVGVRVERVLADRGGPRVAAGDELWLTDPAQYDLRAVGEVAQVATVTQERYVQAKGRIDAARKGKPVIAFAETSRARAGRGRRVAGVEDGLWLPAADALEVPARRAEIERLHLLSPPLR